MNKLLAFLLCLAMLFSLFVSCSTDDSPVSDDGGQTDEYGTWTFKRFVPAKEGDPDVFCPDDVQRMNLFHQPSIYNTFPLHALTASSRDEMIKLVSTLPYDAVYGYYAITLYRLHQEGFYIEPQYDGKSVFDQNGKLVLGPYGGYYGEGGEWRYSCQFDLGEGKNLDVQIHYLPKRYVDYAREYPCLYNSGKPNASEVSDEELIRDFSDFRRELTVEGKKVAAYWTEVDKDRPTLKFVCDAGYMVTLKSNNGDQLDLAAIAEKMSFVKVPLENIAVMQGPAAPYLDNYYVELLGASNRDEMIRMLTEGLEGTDYEGTKHWLKREGFYIEPCYDGRSVFDRDEMLYVITETGNVYDGGIGLGYHALLKLDQGDLYMNVVYHNLTQIKDKYVEWMKEFPCFIYYDGGFLSEEELEKSIYEVTVEGKKIKAYLRTSSEYSQTLYFFCDAGYMVTLESRNGDNLDLLEIAEKMTFTKVPLTETATETTTTTE